MIQRRLKRTYLPDAVKYIPPEGSAVMGWVRHTVADNPFQGGQGNLYGVVRYLHGGELAWIESPQHFGHDVAAAEAWVREQLAALQKD